MDNIPQPAFADALAVARTLAPEDPVILARPQQAKAAAQWFTRRFPGHVLYAVKANPAPWVLDALWEGGVRGFDVASEQEVRLVAERFPQAKLAFMHPVKSRRAIRMAYEKYGVRTFSLDSEAELAKIMEETGNAADLELIIRVAVSGDYAQHKLTGKFGCAGADAVALMRAARRVAGELGVSFHVGSQCMRPEAYRVAMREVGALIREAGVTVDIVDAGGGFPAIYPGLNPPPLQMYVDEIVKAFEAMPVLFNAELWCEPGRALCAEASSHLVRVELRKGDALYINDGAYGALFDAAHFGQKFPVALVRPSGKAARRVRAFELFGPTCDSIDHMKGPYFLPDDVREGDYIEIGMTGAYGAALATQFNGFAAGETVMAADAPMATMYADVAASAPVVAKPR